VIDTDGYVITNNHVVAQADEVLVTLNDKRQFRAKIIGKDQKMDIALLQIRDADKKTPARLAAVPLGDSDKVRIAESVFAVGNPFGLQGTVTLGIISAKNRTIGQGPFDDYLQTDASINPGNSGGPLFNLKGEVVGINTMIFSRSGQSGGLGFAIPINEAKSLLPDLKKYGRVPRPWLGVLGERMTPQLEAYYGLSTSRGVVIYNLVESGPADSGGVRQGDILLAIDGAQTLEPNDVERILAKHRPNDTVELKLKRKSRDLDLRIKLEELPRLENLPQGII
jgi:serine protease Do